jgi:hypothetical protein
MRRYLALLVVLGACYRDAAPAGAPANKAAPADQARAANDELAFIPIDSDVVIGIEVARLRASPVWEQQLASVIEQAAASSLGKVKEQCGFDPIAVIERVTIGMKSRGGDAFDSIFVVRVGDAKRLLACVEREAGKSGTVTKDGEVVLVRSGNTMVGMTVVGGSTLVVRAAATVDRAAIQALLGNGSPLRGSPAFMALYGGLEQDAAVWFTLNGAAPAFGSLGMMGFRPRTIDGTLSVTDLYVANARVTAPSSPDASRLAQLVDSSAASARSMVEQLEIRADGAIVRMQVVMTQAQAQTLLATIGMFMP